MNYLGFIGDEVEAGRSSNKTFVQNYEQWQLPLIDQLNYRFSRDLAHQRLQLERHFWRRLQKELREAFGEVMAGGLDRNRRRADLP